MTAHLDQRQHASAEAGYLADHEFAFRVHVQVGAIGVEPCSEPNSVLEFYSIATRLPAGLRLDPKHAGQLVKEEVLARFTIHDIPPTARGDFIDSIVAERIAGGRVYDAHIAEAARLAGAEVVVTENPRHFVPLMRYGIRVLTAEEFADEFGA